MKILALVPARGGSKRLPGKNIKPLGGLPLIAWTIRAALESKCFVGVLVSTDDQDVADVAESYGASVPWLRPAELASDTASSIDVALHALDAYEAANGQVDGVMLLQPTSPFRSKNTIQKTLAMFKENAGRHSVISVSCAASHPAWCFNLAGANLRPFHGYEGINQRAQDLEPAYVLNGVVYLISPNSLRKYRSFLTENSLALVVDDPVESIDIDTRFDWLVAETVAESHKDTEY